MTDFCPLCGSAGSKAISSKGNAWLVCGKCGTWILQSSLSKEIYPADYYGGESAKFGGPAGALRSRFHAGRANRLRGICGRNGLSLYDIGCGDGAFLQAARERGFLVRGCEPEQVPRKQASECLGENIDCEMFANASSKGWDVITAWQVIEHISDPRGFVRSIKANLKPRGILALSTVNIDSLQARMFRANWLHLDPPRHLWCASLESLERLLSEEGFVVESRRWNWPEFGPVGFVDSAMNTIGFSRDALVHKLKVGFNGFFDPVFWAASVLTPPAIVLAAVESMLRRPSTFELYLKRVD